MLIGGIGVSLFSIVSFCAVAKRNRKLLVLSGLVFFILFLVMAAAVVAAVFWFENVSTLANEVIAATGQDNPAAGAQRWVGKIGDSAKQDTEMFVCNTYRYAHGDGCVTF
jgi:hypothetical protein